MAIPFIALLTLIYPNHANAQWKSNNYGSYAGAVSAVAVAPNGRLIAGSTWDGMFISNDDGVTWVSSKSGLADVDYRLPTLLVSGTKIFLGNISGIFVSSDNGATWSPSGANGMYIRSLFESGPNLIASTTGKIFVSKNNGISWTEASVGSMTPSVVAFTQSGSNLLAAWESTILNSTDNGETWTERSIMPGTYTFAYDIIAFGSDVFSVTSGGLFRSTDSGITWSLQDASKTYGKFAIVNGELFLASDKQIWKSSNGVTWILCNADLNQTGASQFAYSNGKIFLATLKGGLLYSIDNGLNWQPRDNGLVNPGIGSIAAIGQTFIVGTGKGLFRSEGGTTWQKVQATSTQSFTSLLASGSRFLAGTETFGIQISDDDGITWSSSNNGLTSLDVTSLQYIGTTIWAGTRNGLFYSTNNGNSWIGSNVTGTITAIAGSGTVIYASQDPAGMKISSNSGVTWADAIGGLPISMVDQVRSMTVFDGKVYAATSSGIYQTSFGNFWTQFNGISCQSISSDGNNLFYGSFESDVFAFTGLSTIPFSHPNNLLYEPCTILFPYASRLYAIYNSNLYTGRRAGVIYSTPIVALPGVAGFSPTQGKVGSTITITGINMMAAKKKVHFNDLEGTILSATPTALVVSVPPTGGTATIKVTIGTFEATLSNKFFVTPELSSIEPSEGIPGTAITIHGTGFDPGNYYEVKFNSSSAGIVKPATSTTLITYAPVFGYKGPITVVTNEENLITNSNFQVLPVISDFFPKEGTTGTEITITGYGFSTVTGSNSVIFNGVQATPIFELYGSIGVKVPPGLTSGLISVTTLGRTTTTKSPFVLFPLPKDCSWGPQKPLIKQVGVQSTFPVLQSSSIGGNRWYVNGTPFNLSGTNKIVASQNGEYTLQVSIDGCESLRSEAYDVTGLVTDLDYLKSPIQVFPNPVDADLTLDLESLTSEEAITFEICNQLGVIYHHSTAYGGQLHVVDVSDLAPGIYFLRISIEGAPVNHKLIKR